MKQGEPAGAILRGFPSESLPILSERISKIAGLIGDVDCRSRFIELADEAFGLYLLRLESWEPSVKGRDSLKSLARTAGVLAKILEGIDYERSSLIVQMLWLSSDRRGAIAVSDLDGDVERLKRLSAAAGDLTKKSRSKKGAGRTAGPEMVLLVTKVANAYVSSFKVRPSASRSGVFVKLLQACFSAAGVRNCPSETMLRGVFKNLRFNAAPLTRGRKLRPSPSRAVKGATEFDRLLVLDTQRLAEAVKRLAKPAKASNTTKR